jgi:hypothetical protein
MVSNQRFTELALSFTDTSEHPHFHKKAYKTAGKIFCTLDEAARLGMVTLTPDDQYVYCKIPGSAFYPVPGSWGTKGSTYIDLKKVRPGLLREAMQVAWARLQKPKG